MRSHFHLELALANGLPVWPYLESEGALNGSDRAALPPTFLLNNRVLSPTPTPTPHPSRMSCLCGACHLRNMPVSCLHRATSSWQTSACARRAFPWPTPPARSAGRQRSVMVPSDCSASWGEFLKRDFLTMYLPSSSPVPGSWGPEEAAVWQHGGLVVPGVGAVWDAVWSGELWPQILWYFN